MLVGKNVLNDNATRLKTLHEMKRARIFVFFKYLLIGLFFVVVAYVVHRCMIMPKLTPLQKQQQDSLERAKLERMIQHIRSSRNTTMGSSHMIHLLPLQVRTTTQQVKTQLFEELRP